MDNGRGLREPDYDYLAAPSNFSVDRAVDGGNPFQVSESEISPPPGPTYGFFLLCLTVPYAMMWLFVWSQLSEPLTVWLFNDFPATLSEVPFTFAGLATRLVVYPLETCIVFGSALMHLYGLFWTMNQMGMSHPYVRSWTEWSVIRETTFNLCVGVGDRMPKGLLHRALYRDTDGSSSSFGAGGLKSQDDSSQTVWGRGKPLAAIVFFAIYFYAWFYFRIELTFWLVHFASSLPAFPLGSPSTPNPTSYDYILSWYMLLVTSVLYTGIIAFSLFAVVPITWRLGLAPKWLEFYAVRFVGMVSTLAARLCVRQV